MKELSISFSAPMVLALLAGAKSQTRRIVKPQPSQCADDSPAAAPMRCPYGAAGQRLWVREAFRLPSALDAMTPSAAGALQGACGLSAGSTVPIEYAADGARRAWAAPSPPGRLRPPMFMPRWASRLALVVTAVRVERLRAISAADAVAEGVDGGGAPGAAAAIGRYRGVWERIHGVGAWQADPWVWVVSFCASTGDGAANFGADRTMQPASRPPFPELPCANSSSC